MNQDPLTFHFRGVLSIRRLAFHAEPLIYSAWFSHITLAILVFPFVLRLLYLVRRKRFDEHKRLARFVFPIWAYVSATGLIVYLLLYQIYGYA